jgi:hypothetical protein
MRFSFRISSHWASQKTMVNPGTFLGQRKVFMLGEKLAYSEGVKGGYVADALAIIQRRYFKRFPVDLPHDDEPSTEFLEAVDDEEPDPERVEPDRDTLNDEEYEAALEEVEEFRRTISYRKAVRSILVNYALFGH